MWCRFYRVGPCFPSLRTSFIRFYLVIPGNWVFFPGFIECRWVFPAFFHQTFIQGPSFTEFFRISHHFERVSIQSRNFEVDNKPGRSGKNSAKGHVERDSSSSLFLHPFLWFYWIPLRFLLRSCWSAIIYRTPSGLAELLWTLGRVSEDSYPLSSDFHPLAASKVSIRQSIRSGWKKTVECGRIRRGSNRDETKRTNRSSARRWIGRFRPSRGSFACETVKNPNITTNESMPSNGSLRFLFDFFLDCVFLFGCLLLLSFARRSLTEIGF